MEVVSIAGESPLQQRQLPHPTGLDSIFLPGARRALPGVIFQILALLQQQSHRQNHKILLLLLLLLRLCPVHPLSLSHLERHVLFA
jgi:hypothetical protein